MGVDRLIKKRSAGVGTFVFDDIFEPRTQYKIFNISGDLKQVQCENAIGICSEVRITFCSNLHVPHFQRKTYFDEGSRLVPHEKDELLLLLLLHATSATCYYFYILLLFLLGGKAGLFRLLPPLQLVR